MKKRIRVGIAEFPPLVMAEKGRFHGFEIDLWEAIAADLHLTFAYEKHPFQELLPLITQKKIDVALAGITITEEREKHMDFSHATLNSGLLISVNANRNIPRFFKTLGSVFLEDKMVKSAALGLFIFIVLVANLLWWFEKDAGTFSASYIPGLFEAMWFSVVTVSTVGFGDFFPHTWFGRIVTIGIIFGGAVGFGLVVAQVSAFLAVKHIKGDISSSRDLRGKTVATVAGSLSEQALHKTLAKVVSVLEVKQAYQKLQNESVDAVVIDAPAAIYYEQMDQGNRVMTVGELFEKQRYGFALREGSPLREGVNRAILKLIESGTYRHLYKKWFGEDTTMEV